jgi:hypothetical protein
MSKKLGSLSLPLISVSVALSACGGAEPDGVRTDLPAAVTTPSSVRAPTSAAGGTDDGTPSRQACSGALGHGVSATHGRLDGYLVSIVPLGGAKSCNGDSRHVHLQVQMDGGLYDVAVNADGGFFDAVDAPLPGGAWSEGWHTGVPLDYVSAFGVHAADFSTASPSSMAATIENELALANHVSIFGTGYGATGVHDVHRHGGNTDGAIAIDPLSPNAHLLLFHFSNQSF